MKQWSSSLNQYKRRRTIRSWGHVIKTAFDTDTVNANRSAIFIPTSEENTNRISSSSAAVTAFNSNHIPYGVLNGNLESLRQPLQEQQPKLQQYSVPYRKLTNCVGPGTVAKRILETLGLNPAVKLLFYS